jgi:hypothetical protein
MVDHDVIGRAEFDEEIPTFDVPDDALERAAKRGVAGHHLGILHSPLVLLPVATIATLAKRVWQIRPG